MPFQKGISGNPKGKPKGALTLAGTCRKWFEESGFEKLQELALSTDERIQLEALKIFLDRGYGKAKEVITVEGEIGISPIGRRISSDVESSRIATVLVQRLSMDKKENVD